MRSIAGLFTLLLATAVIAQPLAAGTSDLGQFESGAATLVERGLIDDIKAKLSKKQKLTPEEKAEADKQAQHDKTLANLLYGNYETKVDPPRMQMDPTLMGSSSQRKKKEEEEKEKKKDK